MGEEIEQLPDPHEGQTRIETPHGWGWTSDGVEVTLDDGRVIALVAKSGSSELVPSEISNAQFRSALILSGIMPGIVLTTLLSIQDEVPRELAIAKWEYANFVERDHPLIATMAGKFGLSDTQVDELFRVADKL